MLAKTTDAALALNGIFIFNIYSSNQIRAINATVKNLVFVDTKNAKMLTETRAAG